MNILRTDKLNKVYGQGATAVEALKDVNISINEGEFVAIMGPSGSGKSTLLHLLGGLTIPNGGKVFIDNKDIYALDEEQRSIFRRRKIGFVFQFYNLIPALNVEDNIMLPTLLDRKQCDKEYLDEILRVLGIEEKRKCFPGTLSGGQMQRVSIARALISKPSIILADEPTGNLDSKTGKDVLDILQLTVKKYHQTLVMITHDSSIASSAHRVIRLVDGQVVSNKVALE